MYDGWGLKCDGAIILYEILIFGNVLAFLYSSVIAWEHWVNGCNNSKLQMKEKKRQE